MFKNFSYDFHIMKQHLVTCDLNSLSKIHSQIFCNDIHTSQIFCNDIHTNKYCNSVIGMQTEFSTSQGVGYYNISITMQHNTLYQ